MDIQNLGIKDLQLLYLKKELSPLEVVRVLINAINENSSLNAFITVCMDSALKEAASSEKRYLSGKSLGPMDGIPYGIKDIFYSKGTRTTMGSAIYKDFVPEYNASVIDRLNECGAILIGKTNTYEFACSPTGDISNFGTVKNPLFPDLIPGGSSSGSACALAARLIPAAIGSDTGGSVRIPASACGIVGLRPSKGRVSRYGVYSLSKSIDSVGPMTRSVEDNAIFLNALCGYDERDFLSRNLPYEDFRSEMGKGLDGLKIGVVHQFLEYPTQTEVVNVCKKAISKMTDLGADVLDAPSPDPDGVFTKYCRTIRLYEAHKVHSENIRKNKDLYNEEVYLQMKSGENITEKEYLTAKEYEKKYEEVSREILENYDALFLPTLPILPTPLYERTLEINGNIHKITDLLTANTIISSFSGYPAISVNIGLTDEGIPVGGQFIGKLYDEKTLYRIGESMHICIC